MNKYTLYWLSGDRDVVEGSDQADAMNSAGIGAGALAALDFIANGDDHSYTWNESTKKWDRISVLNSVIQSMEADRIMKDMNPLSHNPVKKSGFTITNMDPFPPNENPFNHDSYHMGTYLGTNLCIMHANHDNRNCDYLILVNTITGSRIKIEIDNSIGG